ncbi:unnamed protein product [Trichogramma brassicae]|uniref:Uncharacterized protein n=1 Tax=Trichogramma brassicae TaxID=86971 RepID=A0A6H5IBQ2_9HYME|nr:unnamed protein product [Trichogramma brassicae]
MRGTMRYERRRARSLRATSSQHARRLPEIRGRVRCRGPRHSRLQDAPAATVPAGLFLRGGQRSQRRHLAPAQGMDTEKVIEALTLISKVENAMKSLEKEAGRSYELAAPVAAAAPTSSKLNSKGQDLLLEEVLNTEKAKRTSVPAQIEEQLKALYRLLSDENEDSQRKRRNLDEAYNPSNDQYVYQYANPYPRPVSKYEQAKERFLERREERRQRLRERQEMRRASKEPDSKRESSIDGVTYVYPSQVQQQQPSLAYASQSMPAYSPAYNYPAVDPNHQQYAQSQQTRTFWKRENANAAAIAPQEISDNSRGKTEN